MHTLELGSKVRDVVTGYEGITTARYEYLNGCERYEVMATDKDGKPDGHVFDVQQLELLEPPITMPRTEPVVAPAPPLRRTGGSRSSKPVER